MKARLASLLLRILASTWRMQVSGPLLPERGVVAFWHGEMLPVWAFCRHRRPTALVSASADGALLAQLLTDWSYRVIRGSSSQGGSEALASMTEAAAHGLVLVTPDGPRGPRHEVKPGAVVAAHRAGVPVIPVRARNGWSTVFEKSWDRFELPLPFARVRLTFGEPLTIAPDADREDVDASIRHLQHHLDQMGGG